MTPESDEHLVRYLLGDVPAAEAERLDERSITDESFALRLRMLENDLVDRYARGEPHDLSLQRFDRLHNLSPHLREKVQFAEALNTLATKSQPGQMRTETTSAARQFGWRGVAAAAVLLLAVAGYFGVGNLRLRDEIGQLESRRAVVERQNAQLQQELERMRTVRAAPPSPVTATFLLPPPRRGIGDGATTVTIPRGSEQVTLRLQIESDAYATLWVSLRDAATTRVIWRSGDLSAEGTGADRIVTLIVPVRLLVSQRYFVTLSGVGRASSEVLAQYPIRVVLE